MFYFKQENKGFKKQAPPTLEFEMSLKDYLTLIILKLPCEEAITVCMDMVQSGLKIIKLPINVEELVKTHANPETLEQELSANNVSEDKKAEIIHWFNEMRSNQDFDAHYDCELDFRPMF
ncbi:hypothetical protein [Legionella quateirensis]|uniref:Uncharacterized protein n=1 Tax=Legionella quateirensis TaxID=45072 RepID=A0A378KWT7_9GAMM|nr:hypothetical protein [Legionella quateirensis]KTD44821.1 hypothetical protein Lqua_2656 [Legionella quateirensis]STY16280.1 Uncharacterised protein [Legionella quateirensis]